MMNVSFPRRSRLSVGMLVCLLGLMALKASASAIAVYEFSNEAEEKRFHALLEELRCPKCQNQSLAGSDAQIAQDMKQRVYELMQAGRSDEEIVQYFVERYGDFVSYRPPVRKDTWILWFGPLVMIVLALVFIVLVIRRRQAAVSEPIPDDQQVEALLQQLDKPSEPNTGKSRKTSRPNKGNKA